MNGEKMKKILNFLNSYDIIYLGKICTDPNYIYQWVRMVERR